MENTGLYNKYTIINNQTGQRVPDAFVLKPENDRHARIALIAYSESIQIENPDLAADISAWITGIDMQERIDDEQSAYEREREADHHFPEV